MNRLEEIRKAVENRPRDIETGLEDEPQAPADDKKDGEKKD